MNVRRNLFIAIFSLLCFSCAYNNINYLFDKLTSNTEVKELHFSCNSDSDMDECYRRIIKQGKKNNVYLIRTSYSEDIVNWVLPLNACKLTKGDLAISILINVNEIDDTKFGLLVPDIIKSDYEKYGIRVWWEWIHLNSDNREYVIHQLQKLI